MTNLGPLTTTYTPTGADCTSTYLAANNDNEWIQYGQPDTTQCVPTSFTAFENYYYSPGICPSGYTYACEAGVGTSTTQATCCPSGYTCRTGIDRDTDPFACASTYTSNTYLTFEFYQFTSQTGGTATTVTTSSELTTVYVASDSGYNVEAYGMIVRRSAGDPEWSTSGSVTSATASTAQSTAGSVASSTTLFASSTTSASGSGGGSGSSSGLSAGASAGIGVGVGLGCIIIIGAIVAAYIVGRRKRKSQQAAAQGQGPSASPYADAIPAEGQVAELNSGWKPYGDFRAHNAATEMEAQGQSRSELGGASPPVELPAYHGSR